MNDSIREQLRDLTTKWVAATKDVTKKEQASQDAGAAAKGARNREDSLKKAIAERCKAALERAPQILIVTPTASGGIVMVERGRIRMLGKDSVIGDVSAPDIPEEDTPKTDNIPAKDTKPAPSPTEETAE